MKKLLAIILCLALCMGALAITASAAGTYVVAGAYLAPGDTAETAGAFGTTWDVGSSANVMTDKGDNVYSITYKNAPAGTYKFKVTDGTWDNCWGDNDKNFVINLLKDGDLTLNFNSSTKEITFDAADATSTIKVHARVPSDWSTVAAHYWSSDDGTTWPGVVMTKGSDDWYNTEIPAWAQSIIINNNNNGKQTQDIAMGLVSEIWIVVSDSNSGTLYTSNPDAGSDPDPEPTGTVTVHAKVPEDWAAASAYVWADGSNGEVAWPGTAMTLGTNGWYTVEVPSGVDNIIINNNSGKQTQDIKLIGADEIWIVVEADSNSNTGYTGILTESAPATGDGANLIAVCTAMLLAGAAVITTVAGKKRFF